MLMAVPETAMDKEDGIVFWQYDVGPAGQGFVLRAVDREAVAETMEHGTNTHLSLRVAPPDAGHDFGSFFRCEDVSHEI